jgi:hypothetical protein
MRTAYAFTGTKLNALIHGALDTIADNEDGLLAALEEYRQARIRPSNEFTSESHTTL